MNRIYKVKKNAAGNSVACSEFAKGHAKKAVLGSFGQFVGHWSVGHGNDSVCITNRQYSQ